MRVRGIAMVSAAALALAMAFTVTAGEAAAPPPATVETEAGRRLNEALAIIESRYLRGMTREQLLDRALRALLQDLDPYSFYLDPDEWALRRADLAAEFAGTGVHLELDASTQVPRIQHLLLGSAAAAAGARRGDLILAVDGRSVKGMAIDDVRPWLIGAAGSSVDLLLQRDGVGAPIALTVVRSRIQTPTVRGVRRDRAGAPEYLLDEARGMGYIRISRLARDTVPAVETALEQLQRRRMKSLVLDLRDSEGGLMQAAIGVADLLLDSGAILGNVARGESTHYHAQPGCFSNFPMVVLINAGTASSSEFLAAALQDNGRAMFVGQRTYGKARIQEMLALGEGRGGLILTTGTFERPSGKAVDRHDTRNAPEEAGVAPDPGMEIVVAGEEHEAWWQETSLDDGPVLLEQPDRSPSAPDRPLRLAIELLEAAVH